MATYGPCPEWLLGTECCGFCLQVYSYEQECRCVACDEAVCCHCLRRQGVNIICPHCEAGPQEDEA